MNAALAQTQGRHAGGSRTRRRKRGGNLGLDVSSSLRPILDGVEDKSRVGFCLDTMHSFAAGFDLRTRDGFLKTMDHFDKTVGMKYLRGMHLNDSKVGLNSHVDRHESLGSGLLGLEVFKCIMTDTRFENIPLVLETPNEELWEKEIQQLTAMAG
jgi:deoxyribonuclease-4